MLTCETAPSSSSGVILLPSSSSVDGGHGSSRGDGVVIGSSGDSVSACTELAISTSAVSRCGGHSPHHHENSNKNGNNIGSPSGFIMQHRSSSTLNAHTSSDTANTSIVNLTTQQAYIPETSDPLSFFLDSGKSDRNPFGFGVGSVADGSFGGRKPTVEELLLFRSHRLLQAAAVSVAMLSGNRDASPLQASLSSSHSATGNAAAAVRQQFGVIGTILARQIRLKVLEQTNLAIERVRALGNSATPGQQQDIINAERRSCHRLLVVILDTATSSLQELSGSGIGGSISGGASVGGSGNGGVDGTNSAGADYGMGLDLGRRQQQDVFAPFSVFVSPPTESQQVTDSDQSCGQLFTMGVRLLPRTFAQGVLKRKHAEQQQMPIIVTNSN